MQVTVPRPLLTAGKSHDRRNRWPLDGPAPALHRRQLVPHFVEADALAAGGVKREGVGVRARHVLWGVRRRDRAAREAVSPLEDGDVRGLGVVERLGQHLVLGVRRDVGDQARHPVRVRRQGGHAWDGEARECCVRSAVL